MRQLFNPESLVWKPLGWLGDLVMLSLLWTVFSIPLVTLGAASAALYDTAVHSVRFKDDPLLFRFYATFRRELKEGALSTLFWAGVLLALGLVFFGALRFLPFCAEHWPLMLVAGVLALFFLLGILCWVFPVLSRFTLPLGALHGNAARLALGHSLRSAAMALLWGGTLYLGFRYVLPLFVCPALAALLSSFLIEPVFRRFEQPQEPDAPDR